MITRLLGLIVFGYLSCACTMAQVGRGAAVVELPWGSTLTGYLAWLTWLGVHLALLNGSEEKVSTFVDWGWSLLTHKRGKRIVLGDEN